MSIHSHADRVAAFAELKRQAVADDIRAGAYVPRPGDRVTVRRYISPTTGARTLSAVHTGRVINVSPGNSTGYYLRLDSYPVEIFTGYQFLGAGRDGRSPASLVTEVTPAAEPGESTFYSQLSPDLAVMVDGSQCIVLVVIDPATQETVRTVTVTNVEDLKAILGQARGAQQAETGRADRARQEGLDEARRARGQLTRTEASQWLVDRGHTRADSLTITRLLHADGCERAGMTYDGKYWVVPVTTEQPAR